MNILDKIVEKRKITIEESKKKRSPKEVKEAALAMAESELQQNGRFDYSFRNNLMKGDIQFICEVKKASPSKGLIAEHFPYLEIAKDYEKAGAAAISVLTEPEFFLGRNEYLKEIAEAVDIPVLRKDFVIDEYQIYEAKTLGASAVLLICAILDDETLKDFLDIAHSIGLSALVEAHDEHEVKRAIAAGAKIIGVNNRDLKTFNVDINNSVRLRKLVPEDVVFVSESGIRDAGDVAVLRENGTNAVLIGETLMRSDDKKQMLNNLRGKTKVKICGLRRPEDVSYVNECLPDFAGFVFAETRRKVTMEQAAKLRELLDDAIASVGVFVNAEIDYILSLIECGIISFVQLHGDEDEQYIRELRNRISGETGSNGNDDIKIIKAIRVSESDDRTSVKKQCDIYKEADYLLFDTYSSKMYGGTGKTFDWSSIKDITEKPYFLAGGINADNVRKAVDEVRPYAVDVSSAVETDGFKDRDKILDFVASVRS